MSALWRSAPWALGASRRAAIRRWALARWVAARRTLGESWVQGAEELRSRIDRSEHAFSMLLWNFRHRPAVMSRPRREAIPVRTADDGQTDPFEQPNGNCAVDWSIPAGLRWAHEISLWQKPVGDKRWRSNSLALSRDWYAVGLLLFDDHSRRLLGVGGLVLPLLRPKLTSAMASHRPVLVVDDNADVREGLALLLRAEGFTVETADNGRAALAALYAGVEPCAIVLDLDMPVMGGKAFRQEQLNHPRFAHIPVIVLSGESDPQVTLHMQANATAIKPVEMPQLLALVEQFCRTEGRPK
jgi:CheY-like chemotaxis protein